MASADFRFHDRLNDFLPPTSRDRILSRNVSRRATIKDVIESLGVPHTEVDVAPWLQVEEVCREFDLPRPSLPSLAAQSATGDSSASTRRTSSIGSSP